MFQNIKLGLTIPRVRIFELRQIRIFPTTNTYLYSQRNQTINRQTIEYKNYMWLFVSLLKMRYLTIYTYSIYLIYLNCISTPNTIIILLTETRCRRVLR